MRSVTDDRETVTYDRLPPPTEGSRLIGDTDSIRELSTTAKRLLRKRARGCTRKTPDVDGAPAAVCGALYWCLETQPLDGGTRN